MNQGQNLLEVRDDLASASAAGARATGGERVGAIDRERLSELIHAIYAASESPGLWPSFLAALADELDSTMTALVTFRSGDGGAGDGPAAVSIADPDLATTSFRNNFAQTLETFHALNATFVADAQLGASLACHLPHAAPAPAKAHELLELLVPHLARAVRFQRRWSALKLAEQASVDAVARAGTGFVLLDGSGAILRTNELADEVLRRGDGLCRREGRLRATRSQDDAELRSSIVRAAGTALERGVGRGSALPVARPGGSLPYVVMLTPFGARTPVLRGRGTAVVALVADPAQEPSLSPLRMQRALGWTQAEAEVASLLLAGRSTREIAAARGVGFETVRAQLKSLYRKSGVAGQADLVRLLMAGAPGLARPALVPKVGA